MISSQRCPGAPRRDHAAFDWSLILNKAADEYYRSSAMRAMVFAVVGGMIPREDVLALFGSLFTGHEASADSSFLVLTC